MKGRSQQTRRIKIFHPIEKIRELNWLKKNFKKQSCLVIMATKPDRKNCHEWTYWLVCATLDVVALIVGCLGLDMCPGGLIYEIWLVGFALKEILLAAVLVAGSDFVPLVVDACRKVLPMGFYILPISTIEKQFYLVFQFFNSLP